MAEEKVGYIQWVTAATLKSSYRLELSVDKDNPKPVIVRIFKPNEDEEVAHFRMSTEITATMEYLFRNLPDCDRLSNVARSTAELLRKVIPPGSQLI